MGALALDCGGYHDLFVVFVSGRLLHPYLYHRRIPISHHLYCYKYQYITYIASRA